MATSRATTSCARSRASCARTRARSTSPPATAARRWRSRCPDRPRGRGPARRACARAIEALEMPLLDGQGALRVTASFGVAALPVRRADKDGLVAAADARSYRAKRAGKNRTVVPRSAGVVLSDGRARRRHPRAPGAEAQPGGGRRRGGPPEQEALGAAARGEFAAEAEPPRGAEARDRRTRPARPADPTEPAVAPSGAGARASTPGARGSRSTGGRTNPGPRIRGRTAAAGGATRSPGRGRRRPLEQPTAGYAAPARARGRRRARGDARTSCRRRPSTTGSGSSRSRRATSTSTDSAAHR